MSELNDAYAASARSDRGSLNERPRSPFLVQERLSSRFAMPSQITVYREHAYVKLHEVPERFWVTTRDISSSGISFQYMQRMYYGERLRLELRMDGGDVRDVAAMIVRCHRRPDGSFDIGASFEEKNAELPPAEPKEAELDGADL